MKPCLPAVTRHIASMALAAIVMPQASRSQERLSLGAAMRAAQAQFPAVAAARETFDASHAASGEARGPLWPTLRLSGAATQYEEPTLVLPLHSFRPSEIPPFDTTVLQGSLSAGWTVFDGGARSSRIHSADHQQDEAAATLLDTEQDLALRTVRAYLDVLTGQAILTAQDQRIAALDAETDRSQRLRSAGRAADVEVLRAEAARAAAEAERVRIAANLDVTERDLARLTGLDVETTRAARLVTLVLADSTAPDRQALQRTARDANPALRAAQARTATAVAAQSLSRSARWPELKAAAAYNGWSDGGGHDALEWNAGLQLAYPFFTGGATTHGIERASASQRAALERERLAGFDVDRDVDRAVARWAAAQARVQSLAVATARLVEVARIEQLSLGTGAGTQTDYLRAEADLANARGALAESRYGAIAAAAELARLVGALDEAWIARTLEETP